MKFVCQREFCLCPILKITFLYSSCLDFRSMADLGIYPGEFAGQISRSVGTRNILVHEYDKVDYQKVYDSVSDCLRDYHQYCEYILGLLDKINKDNATQHE